MPQIYDATPPWMKGAGEGAAAAVDFSRYKDQRNLEKARLQLAQQEQDINASQGQQQLENSKAYTQGMLKYNQEHLEYLKGDRTAARSERAALQEDEQAFRLENERAGVDSTYQRVLSVLRQSKDSGEAIAALDVAAGSARNSDDFRFVAEGILNDYKDQIEAKEINEVGAHLQSASAAGPVPGNWEATMNGALAQANIDQNPKAITDAIHELNTFRTNEITRQVTAEQLTNSIGQAQAFGMRSKAYSDAVYTLNYIQGLPEGTDPKKYEDDAKRAEDSLRGVKHVVKFGDREIPDESNWSEYNEGVPLNSKQIREIDAHATELADELFGMNKFIGLDKDGKVVDMKISPEEVVRTVESPAYTAWKKAKMESMAQYGGHTLVPPPTPEQIGEPAPNEWRDREESVDALTERRTTSLANKIVDGRVTSQEERDRLAKEAGFDSFEAALEQSPGLRDAIIKGNKAERPSTGFDIAKSMGGSDAGLRMATGSTGTGDITRKFFDDQGDPTGAEAAPTGQGQSMLGSVFGTGEISNEAETKFQRSKMDVQGGFGPEEVASGEVGMAPGKKKPASESKAKPGMATYEGNVATAPYKKPTVKKTEISREAELRAGDDNARGGAKFEQGQMSPGKKKPRPIVSGEAKPGMATSKENVVTAPEKAPTDKKSVMAKPDKYDLPTRLKALGWDGKEDRWTFIKRRIAESGASKALRPLLNSVFNEIKSKKK